MGIETLRRQLRQLRKKVERIQDLIRSDPELTDEAIAERCESNPTAVANIRHNMRLWRDVRRVIG